MPQTKSKFLLGCAVAAILSLACLKARADRVYSLSDDYTFSEPGWSFDGGTLTTNGFVGAITPSNVDSVFTDWRVSFTSPEGQYLATPLNSFISYVDHDANNMSIAENEIAFPNNGSTVTRQDTLILFKTDLSLQQGLQWSSKPSDFGFGPSLILEDRFVEFPATVSVSSQQFSTGIAPHQIASVPEPSACLLLLALCCGVGGCRWIQCRGYLAMGSNWFLGGARSAKSARRP